MCRATATLHAVAGKISSGFKTLMGDNMLVLEYGRTGMQSSAGVDYATKYEAERQGYMSSQTDKLFWEHIKSGSSKLSGANGLRNEI
jgi:hypothetical protein